MLEGRECIDFERCSGCDRITTFKLDNGASVRGCSVYLKPSVLWNRGGCPFMYAWKETVKTIGKKRVGQQKQRKGV